MISDIWQRFELSLTGPLAADVRRNMRFELSATLAYGPFQAALLFIPVVLERMGASSQSLAIYQSETYIGFMLSALSVLFLPRKRLILFLAAVWILGRSIFMLTPLMPTVTGLLLISGVFWVSDSLPSPGYVRVVQRIYPANARARIMSTVRLGMAFGMLAFTPVAGWLLDTVGPRVLFPIAGAFGIGAALLFTRIRFSEAAESQQQTQPKHSLRELVPLLKGNKAFVLYLLSITAFGLAGLIPIAFYPAVLVNRLHLSYSQVSWLGLAQSVCWLAGYLVWGRLLDRFGGAWALRVMYLMLVLYPLCHWIATSAWILLPAYIVTGITSAGIDLAFTKLTIDLAEPEYVTEYAALMRTTIGIRGLIGPLLGVWLSQIGVPLPAIFSLAIALYLLSAVLITHRSFRYDRVNSR